MTPSKFNKSAIMKRAWRIYKGGNYSKRFSDCLSRAWFVEKENIRYNAEQERINAWVNRKSVKVEFTAEQKQAAEATRIASLTNYYANNTYNGD